MVDDAAVVETTELDFPEWLTGPDGPLGPEAVIIRGERLRFWGLSEVWRLQLGGPASRSVIVKRGTGEMAEEARIYRKLVVPLAIAAPTLLAATGGDGIEPVVLVLEDVGRDTLEQRPTADGYRAAVRALARMRAAATRRLADKPAIGAGLRWTTADFVDTTRRADRGLATVRPDLASALETPARVLIERLGRLTEQPDTIVHGDFHAKNLIHAGDGRIFPVDWPGAYVHPHLGDLYCLMREADKHGLARDIGTADLPEVFAREAGVEPDLVRDQLVTGGLCWTLIALRWVVEEGIHAVPESRDWIDELVTDLQALAGQQV
jgi:hypothetical protein